MVCVCVCVWLGWGHSLSSGTVVQDLGQAPAAEAGEDEGCRPRLATRLTLNSNWQINHLYRGHRVCLGQPAQGAEGCHTDPVGARRGQVRSDETGQTPSILHLFPWEKIPACRWRGRWCLMSWAETEEGSFAGTGGWGDRGVMMMMTNSPLLLI